MNKTLLQVFLLLAFIPLAILVGYGVLVVAPIFCCFLAINSYKYKNYKEMYIWMGVGVLSFLLALYLEQVAAGCGGWGACFSARETDSHGVPSCTRQC